MEFEGIFRKVLAAGLVAHGYTAEEAAICADKGVAKAKVLRDIYQGKTTVEEGVEKLVDRSASVWTRLLDPDICATYGEKAGIAVGKMLPVADGVCRISGKLLGRLIGVAGDVIIDKVLPVVVKYAKKFTVIGCKLVQKVAQVAIEVAENVKRFAER